jgi:hypothetical protein
VVIAGQIFVHNELPKVAGAAKLLVSRAEAPLARSKGRAAGVRRLFMTTHMDNADNLEVRAVVPLPSAAERRRREVMPGPGDSRAIDIILAGDSLGWDTPVVTQ